MLSLQVFVTLKVSRLANDRLTIKHKRQDPKTCDIEAAYDFILAVVYLLIKQRNYFCSFQTWIDRKIDSILNGEICR